MIALAVDVGGTKVAVALVDRSGAILKKTSQPTDLRGVEQVVDQIEAMSKLLLDGLTPVTIGVCVPAVLESDTDRIIWAPNLPGWEGADVKGILGARLGVPAAIEYDGHAAVMGEWWIGEGRGCDNVASIIIGTGIGAGFIERGRLLKGRNRLAGAIGWFPVHTAQGTMSWEAVASGLGIARRAQQLMAQNHPTTLQSDGLSAKLVFDAARQGDDIAVQVIEEAAYAMGLGVSAVVSFANPEIIILGGSVGQHSEQMLPTIQRVTAQYGQPYAARDLPIVCSKLGEEAGLLGAAYSAFQQYER